MIYGNHDMAKKNHLFMKNNLHGCQDFRSWEKKPLFEDLLMHEAIVFANKDNNIEILAVHGHQADFMNYNMWILGMFFSRFFLRRFELLGSKSPINYPPDNLRMLFVERRLQEWAWSNHRIILAGHTHRPAFASIGGSLYFNTGSCINNNCITCIEVENSEIALVSWSINGNTHATRKLLSGPQELAHYKKHI